MKMYRFDSRTRRKMLFGSELYVSIPAACSLLSPTYHVSEWTIRTAAESGEIKRYEYGRHHLVYLPEVETFVDNICKRRSEKMTKTDADVFDSFQWYHESRHGIEGIETGTKFLDCTGERPRMKKELVPLVIEQYTGLEHRKVMHYIKRYTKMGFLEEKDDNKYCYFNIVLIRKDIYRMSD